MQDTVWLDTEKDLLMYIDQTQLPGRLEIRSCCDCIELHGIIKRLEIRGAPAIGVAAAIGIYAAAVRFEDTSPAGFMYSLRKNVQYLSGARPTAVNLRRAAERMLSRAESSAGFGIPEVKKALKDEALAIYNESIADCRAIGEYGEPLIKDGACILTHCNAGALAAVRYGTALAPVYVAAKKGKKVSVIADETRPLLQGARLTAFELAQSGIPVTLECDDAAASAIASGKVDIILVGADRIAANGDTANKVGTLALAVIAKRYNIPFYVCAPFSTFDADTAGGGDIVIEQRPSEEVTHAFFAQCSTHPAVNVYNPAFDVTPAELITGFITERGIFMGEQLKNER